MDKTQKHQVGLHSDVEVIKYIDTHNARSSRKMFYIEQWSRKKIKSDGEGVLCLDMVVSKGLSDMSSIMNKVKK